MIGFVGNMSGPAAIDITAQGTAQTNLLPRRGCANATAVFGDACRSLPMRAGNLGAHAVEQISVIVHVNFSRMPRSPTLRLSDCQPQAFASSGSEP